MYRSRRSRVFATAFAGLPVLAIVLGATTVAAFADDDGTQAPDPGVARVSIIAGGVDVKRGDSGDTVAAAVNAPLSPGDYLSTREDSHAEVQFDYGTDLRVGPNTQLRFTQLDPKNHQLQLAAGTVDLHVAYGLTANAQIQTPQATIQPDENGSYIVNVDDQGNSQVTARSGRVDVISEAGTQTIVPGTTLAITGDVDHPQFRSVDAIAYEGFDSWLASRDAAVARVSDDRYVEAGMVGAGDLDQHGSWVEYPQYGRVWVPAVAAGWAPYHDGRWVWEPHYGWTWVDNEPWGWAPFHYGNWFYAANVGWAWYPGAYAVARPYVYRPALVAFFNFGGGGGNFSVGFGNVGWVPIAPYEPFHPWWGGRSTVAYNTTIVNNTTIINNYTNLHAPGGIVGVTNRNFAGGNFAGVRTLEPVEIRGAEPIRGVLPIVPTQRNLALRDHENGFRPLQPVARFGTFRTQPQIVGPTFAEQQARIQTVAVHAYPREAETITHYATREPGINAEPGYARPASPTTDAFGRFNHEQTQGAPVQAAPAYHEPVYHEPAYREPSYREPIRETPEYRAPVAPVYHPAYHAPAYHPSHAASRTVSHPALIRHPVKHHTSDE